MVATKGVVSHAQLDRLAQVGSVSLQFLWVTHQMYEFKGWLAFYRSQFPHLGMIGKLNEIIYGAGGAWHRGRAQQTGVVVVVSVFILLPS